MADLRVKEVFVFSLCIISIALAAKQKSTEGRFRRHLTKRQQGNCGVGYFQCTNGQCVQIEWTCDHDNDCGDNSDETLPSCPAAGHCTGAHEFLCTNGKCLSIEFHCDGTDECGDGSDEKNCASTICSQGYVRCGTKELCIDVDWLCDGDDDCGNGWDEQPQNCHHTSG